MQFSTLDYFRYNRCIITPAPSIMPEDIRKLAAIMFTDMVGYSALSQKDERLALDLLAQHNQILRAIFPLHNGTEIKTIGDAFLLEFPSALESTRCAIAMQKALWEHNKDLDEINKLIIRIGIHIGDVVYRNNDIFGDGVNIAARIEPLAHAGGICISEDVARQVRNKLDIPMEKLDATRLKNIELPIDIYKLLWTDEKYIEKKKSRLDKFKIAVLPFTNYSTEADSDYFSDGLSEELMMQLSHIKELKVISRSTTMQYKNSGKDSTTIGHELGTRNILEGSVRRAQDKLRITVQLIDVESDTHLWAKTFKGKIDDIFEIQEEVAEQIAEALKLELTTQEKVELSNHATLNTEALDCNLRAREFMYRRDKESVEAAIGLFERAVELDPKYAVAYAGLGECNALMYRVYTTREAGFVEKSIEYSLKALMFDNSLPEAYSSLAMAYYSKESFQEAKTAVLKAIELDDTNFFSYWILGRIYHSLGKYEEAKNAYIKSISLNKIYYATYGDLYMAYKNLGEEEKAQEALQEALIIYPLYLLKYPSDITAQMHFAISLADVNRIEEAKVQAEKFIHKETTDSLLLYNSACFYAIIGEKDLAIDKLDKALTYGSLGNDHIYNDPDLINIHNEPRFIELMNRV